MKKASTMYEPRPIIVTGASRGVGLELTRQLIASGQNVVGIARHRPEIHGSDRLRFIPCDLADRDAVTRLIHELIELRPRGLINNAAIQTEQDWATLSPEEMAERFAAEIQVDLVAPMRLSYGLLPVIKNAEDGFICNINSALALAPKVSAPAYCAAKAALRNATVSLRGSTRGLPDLLVNETYLPLVDTDMTKGRGRGKISAEAAANAILEGLSRRQTETWVGQTRLLRLLWRLAPSRTSRMLLDA